MFGPVLLYRRLVHCGVDELSTTFPSFSVLHEADLIVRSQGELDDKYGEEWMDLTIRLQPILQYNHKVNRRALTQ